MEHLRMVLPVLTCFSPQKSVGRPFPSTIGEKRLHNAVCIMDPGATVKTSRGQLKLNPTFKA